MLSFRRISRDTFRSFATLVSILLAGCGNACFVAVSNNGSGSVNVKVSNPPPTCSLSVAMGAMNVVAVRAPAIQDCPSSTCAAHVFVTIRSIRLHSSTTEPSNSKTGFELAPFFASEPRQFDLLGQPPSEILASAAPLPAGNYRELRLQFVASSTGNTAPTVLQNACGGTEWSCVVTRDGRTEPLHWLGDAPELAIPLAGSSGGPLIVLPDSQNELRLSMQVQAGLARTKSGWQIASFLVGKASATPLNSTATASFASH